ncbi:sugar kinase [Anianabacter salinae]|uniref:sugar kinase n=1 Tax=Anianabacter salinae TaxID=2851023 RepID=UPI00225DDE65|nr:sugar kinase [Anianabacter salinae]MBV0912227.1 sugar kinase [Anianabacter salinae]
MTRIVAIGECMVEMSPLERDGEYRMGFAGDTMNTAWYLRRLLGAGHSVDYLTAIGTDGISDRMLAFLTGAGIGTDHIARLPDRTVGLYLIQLQDGERSFSYWRGQSAARSLAADRAALEAALTKAQMAYVSGITLAILPPGDRATLQDVLRTFRAGGGQVAFDPNLRPRLWSDPAEMTRAVMQAASVCDIALPSFDDEAAHFGDASPATTAARYAEAGARLVIVKDGARRILSRNGTEIAEHDTVPAPDVVDTTAAGDSFNAGCLAGLIDGKALADAIRAGATLAAQVVQARGALVEID